MKLLLVLVAFSNLVFAQAEFKGNLRGSSFPCSLQINQIYYTNNIETPENLRADVIASFDKDDHHLGQGEVFFFTIKPGARSNLYSGFAANQKDQINILTKPGSIALDIVESFSMKWWHTNHYDSAQCVNLKRVN